jgi:hypothetical protein
MLKSVMINSVLGHTAPLLLGPQLAAPHRQKALGRSL